MIPTAPKDHTQQTPADDQPRFFVDDSYDACVADGDWWLDLGAVNLPTAPAV